MQLLFELLRDCAMKGIGGIYSNPLTNLSFQRQVSDLPFDECVRVTIQHGLWKGYFYPIFRAVPALCLKKLLIPSTMTYTDTYGLSWRTSVDNIIATILYPYDCIKVITRIKGLSYIESFEVYTQSNMYSIYSGLLPVVIRTSFYRVLYFNIHNFIVPRVKNRILLTYFALPLVGMLTEIPFYPLTTIATNMVMERVSGNTIGMIECIRMIYQSKGILGFYYGFGIGMIRYILVGFTFDIVDRISKYISGL